MEDILRDLYEGQYCARLNKKAEHIDYLKADEKCIEISDDMIKFLNEHGIDDADDLVNRWIQAWFTFTDEELIIAYKKGVKFGFEIYKEMSEGNI